MLYEYKCDCGKIFEEIHHVDTPTTYCKCGRIAKRKPSVVHATFGWRLSDESLNVKGHPDELVRNI